MDYPKDIRDDIEDDLDVCKECTGTWKVACYGAWYPHSQFWKDFLDEEEGWEGSVYSPQACCLRFLCGVLFCFFAPLWCCKAILFFLFWPCICGIRALKEGNCNKTYFRFQRSKQARYEQRRSQPLAYVESQPTHPYEIPYQFSPKSIPPESPIPEIRIETEQENGTYVTSPVDDDTVDHQLPATNGRTAPWVIKTRGVDQDLPPAYPASQTSRTRSLSDSRGYAITNQPMSDRRHHSTASKTLSTKARGMDNNLYRTVMMEGITGKVTSV